MRYKRNFYSQGFVPEAHGSAQILTLSLFKAAKFEHHSSYIKARTGAARARGQIERAASESSRMALLQKPSTAQTIEPTQNTE